MPTVSGVSVIDELPMPDLSAMLTVARLDGYIARRQWHAAYLALDDLKDSHPERFHDHDARAPVPQEAA